MSYKWLEWARKIQAISQSGLAFSKDDYDIERYDELRKISGEILAHYTDVEMDRIPDLFMNETGYQTPKIDVRGAVFKNDEILLVREKKDDKWSLPGGFCDVGLSPAENIIKEIREESGFTVRADKLLALLDMDKHPHPPQPFHYYKVFVQCQLVGGNAESGLETKDVRFFAENDLPTLSTARNTESQIQMLFEFLRDPSKQPVFD